MTVRSGVRAGSSTVVVHMLPGSSEPGSIGVSRFGFVVSKQVGNAVQRNVVRRRLRAAAWERRAQWQPGSNVVVRALPASRDASFETLESDLVRTVERLERRTRSADRAS
ncbi:hypothetical protein GCM10025865_13640 [Paraoerskovia sediminicola]|uniref:Ribonuclease P protein component n=1 Tax=Paraoerskovia sediminicola TaxID=1138587 RepID=A0ABN6XBH0_9CELL|nr:ribonuclease P protein component [Paraoerskovia sediminicola]BDZ42065.1 hypothetical protein GCM10025865_13640 [Paraoerskovia sediminicola]